MVKWSSVPVCWWLVAGLGLLGAEHSEKDIDVFLQWRMTCMVVSTIKEPQGPRTVHFSVVGSRFCARFARASWRFAIYMRDVGALKDDTFVADQIPTGVIIAPGSFDTFNHRPKALWLRSPTVILDFPTDVLLELRELRMLYLVNFRIVRTHTCKGNNTFPPTVTHLILSTTFDTMNETLPEKFLIGLTKLSNFTASNFKFTTVPKDLFKYSPKMKLIDLSHNLIEHIEKDFFAAQEDMEVLLLHNNRFTLKLMDSLRSMRYLKEIDLSHNPIGDFCKTTEESIVIISVYYLRILRLSDTGITHVCYDWFNVLMTLDVLDLSNNNIRKFSCSDLDMERGQDLIYPHINFSGNPLESITCSRYIHRKSSKRPYFIPPLPMATLEISTKLKCDCNSYWFKKMVEERRIPVNFTPEYEHPCQDDWVDCIPVY